MLLGISQRSVVLVSCVFTLTLCVLVWRLITQQSEVEDHLHPIKKSIIVQDSLNHGTPSRDEVEITSLSITADTTIETKPAKNDETTPLPSIPAYDVMPFSAHLKSRAELQKTQWVATLYEYLQTLNTSISPHVNIVFGDHAHGRLVLNWVTSALKILQPPLHNVMVLSLDHLLCDSLTNRNFPLTCIAVPAESIFTTNARDKWTLGLMVRFPVLRLINYWGYDVAAYDSDAVLLHNPQVLYAERPSTDVFSGAGTFPFDVSKRWGFTLCAGSLMLRASPAVGNIHIMCPCLPMWYIASHV